MKQRIPDQRADLPQRSAAVCQLDSGPRSTSRPVVLAPQPELRHPPAFSTSPTVYTAWPLGYHQVCRGSAVSAQGSAKRASTQLLQAREYRDG